MRAVKPLSSLVCGVFLVGICTCQPFDLVPRLGAPEITHIGLTEARLSGTWREAIHLRWEMPSTDSISIRSYTIIRQAANDSLYDVFTRSQGIPSSIDSFNDDIKPLGFPQGDFSPVRYRIFALDSLGRSSDTSAPCSLYLARQPEIDTIDITKSSFRWMSRFIQGSVDTYLKIWDAGGAPYFTSARQEEFGSWDYPVYFVATLPDSLSPFSPGTWYYAIYLFAMGTERQSIKVDSFNVDQ